MNVVAAAGKTLAAKAADALALGGAHAAGKTGSGSGTGSGSASGVNGAAGATAANGVAAASGASSSAPVSTSPEALLQMQLPSKRSAGPSAHALHLLTISAAAGLRSAGFDAVSASAVLVLAQAAADHLADVASRIALARTHRGDLNGSHVADVLLLAMLDAGSFDFGALAAFVKASLNNPASSSSTVASAQASSSLLQPADAAVASLQFPRPSPPAFPVHKPLPFDSSIPSIIFKSSSSSADYFAKIGSTTSAAITSARPASVVSLSNRLIASTIFERDSSQITVDTEDHSKVPQTITTPDNISSNHIQKNLSEYEEDEDEEDEVYDDEEDEEDDADYGGGHRSVIGKRRKKSAATGAARPSDRQRVRGGRRQEDDELSDAGAIPENDMHGSAKSGKKAVVNPYIAKTRVQHAKSSAQESAAAAAPAESLAKSDGVLSVGIPPATTPATAVVEQELFDGDVWAQLAAKSNAANLDGVTAPGAQEEAAARDLSEAELIQKLGGATRRRRGSINQTPSSVSPIPPPPPAKRPRLDANGFFLQALAHPHVAGATATGPTAASAAGAAAPGGGIPGILAHTQSSGIAASEKRVLLGSGSASFAIDGLFGVSACSTSAAVGAGAVDAVAAVLDAIGVGREQQQQQLQQQQQQQQQHQPQQQATDASGNSSGSAANNASVAGAGAAAGAGTAVSATLAGALPALTANSSGAAVKGGAGGSSGSGSSTSISITNGASSSGASSSARKKLATAKDSSSGTLRMMPGAHTNGAAGVGRSSGAAKSSSSAGRSTSSAMPSGLNGMGAGGPSAAGGSSSGGGGSAAAPPAAAKIKFKLSSLPTS
ncbi:hypothetical protein HDU84_003542 [Entophlyctis sp. JEL0112]|nr:hypothetical protein HDU84_003542 [Entophlyctis sp. JEL0112]